MKKTFAYLLFAILLIAFSAIFAACGLLQNNTNKNNYDDLHAVYVSYAENGGTLSYNQWLASLQGEKEEILSIAKSESEEDAYVVTYSDGTTSLYSPKTHTNTFFDDNATDENEQEDNKTDDNGGSISEPDDQNGSGNGGNGSITDPNGNADEGGGNSADQGDSANTGDNTGNENSGEGDDNGNTSDGQSGNITDPNGNSGENGSSDETGNGDNQGGTTEDPHGNTGDNGSGDSGNGDDNGSTSDDPNGNGGESTDPNGETGDNGGSDSGNGDDPNGTTDDPNGNTGDNQSGNEPTPTTPDTPILSASAGGIAWTEVTGATAYSVRTDDGDWTTASSRTMTFSEKIGEHTFYVRALNGEKASDPASFTYTTKALSLSALTVNGLTVTWSAEGKDLSFTMNGEKAAYDFVAGVYSYTCPADIGAYALSVTVSGGYLEDAALYYPVGTRTENKTVTVAALPAPSLSASAAGITWEEVAGATSYGVRTDGGIWTEQTTRIIPLLSSTTNHTVEVKALSSDPSRLESAAASCRYETKMLALSDVTRNGLTFSWSATTTESGMSLTLNGNNAAYETTSAAHYRYVLASAAGDYALRVTAAPSFDERNSVYYYGAEPIEKTANFSISVLPAPSLALSSSGISWEEITNAASYGVSIDGKSETTQSSRSVALSAVTGKHSVTVKALSSDPAFLESPAASYVYETKALALSNITRDGLTFSWTATAAPDRIALTVNNVETAFEILAAGSYAYEADSAVGTYALRVTASPSFDDENKVYYYAENAIEQTASVTISTLGSPHFSASASGVTWSAVSNASSYSVSIDGGEATTQTSRSVALSTAAGDHSVTVKALSSDPARTDGASVTYTYETKTLALSDIARDGLTFSWTATVDPSQMSLSLNGTAKNYETTSEQYTYTIPSSAGTRTLTVRVNPSFNASARVYYYAAAAIEKTASVTISALSAPVLSASAEGVSWTAVTDASAYKVRRENSGWETVSGLGADLDLTAGEHSVEVKAIPDPADPTRLDSPVTAYYYEIKRLTLSDISRTDLDFSWTTISKPEATTFTVNNISTEYSAISLTKYHYTLPSEVGDYNIKVRVEPLFDATNNIYYYSESAIEKTASLTISKLGTPVLTASISGVAWTEISGADAYSVSIDNGAWTEQTDRKVPLSDSAAAHSVRVQAVSSDAAVLTGEIASYAYETCSPQLSTLSREKSVVTWTATTYTPNMTLTRNNVSYPFETVSEGHFRYVIPSESGQHSLSVSVSSGFDAENAIYYYTTNPSTRTMSVTFTRLATPALSASLSGVIWNSVSSASSYKVSVDGGQETSTTVRSAALSTATGNHSVTVKAVSSQDTVLDSEAATYSYETKALALSDLSKNNLTVSWTATAADDHIFIYVNNESMGTAASSSEVTHSVGGYRYTGIPQAEGSYEVQVTAESSFASNVYYYAANSITKSITVTVSKLATPTLTKGDSSISWSAVSHAASYSVYTDSGTASSQTSRSASYSSSTGKHTFYARAIAEEGTAYVSSDRASVSYYTTPVSLSSLTFKGITAHWVASAKSVRVKEDSGSYTATSLSEYEIKSRDAKTHTVYVQASGGYDSSSNIYYSGSAVTKDAPKTLSLASTTLTFEDQTSKNPYAAEYGSTDASNWTQEYWVSSNESWATTSKQMNSRDGNSGRVVNLTSSQTKHRYTYQRGANSNFGLTNTFSVLIGNYHTAYDIWYKISLIDTDGCVHYLAGATNKFVRSESTGTESTNKVFTRISYTGFDPIEVSAIRFEVYGSTGSDSTYCYFYIDDVTLSYVSPDLGSAASYSGGNFTVSAGGSTSKNFSAGYADAMSFTLQNKSSSATAQAVVTLYNGENMVATGTYVLYASATQSYTLIFNKWRVTKFTVAASYANVGVSSVSLGTSNTYAVTDNAMYRVASTSGSTSILLMGEEVRSSATISYNLTAIKQLQKYASDVSPLFASIVNVGQILSATYAQSIDVTSNASSTGTYGTLTINYIESGASSLTTSTITVKRKDSAGLNEATRDAYSRNLWKNISVDPHSVLLAGSSSMEKWETYSQDMKGIKIADVGIGGTVSTDWSKDGGLAERLIYAYNPRAIILFVGVNDLKGGKTVESTLTDVKALIQQIHTKLPNAKVYYVLINKVPLAISGSNQLTESNVISFNNSMASYANNYNWLTTLALDTTNHMAYSGGSGYDFNYNDKTKAYDKTTYYGKTSFFDSMHLNQAGYTEWAYVIRQKFLALDKKATWAKTD